MKIEPVRQVFPGDRIPEKGFKDYGIFKDRAVLIGVLCKIEDLYFIKSRTKIYSPRKYDIVIGRTIYTSQDYHRIDLNGCTGILPALSFLNATKRNRPELEKGDFVVCQVLRVEGGDPLLCCRREGLGKIDEAFPVESWKIRLLYFNSFIKSLSRNKTFKIIMAMNGYIWLEGDPETKREILNRINEYR